MCYDKGNFTKGKNRQMLGRTHFFIGTAAALAVLQPQTIPALVAGGGGGPRTSACFVDSLILAADFIL